MIYAITNPFSNQANNLLERTIASTALPGSGALSQTARQIDPYQRGNTGDVTESLMANIPGVSQQLAPIRDILGHPVEQASMNLGQMQPVGGGRMGATSPLISELQRLQKAVPDFHGIGTIDRKLGDLQLSSQEYDQIQILVGAQREKRWSELIASPAYQAMSNPEKVNAIRNDDAKARSAGKYNFGLIRATQATADSAIAGSAKIAMNAATQNYDKAGVIERLASIGKLTPTVIAEIDNARERTVKGEEGYDPTVEELTEARSLFQYHSMRR